MADQRSAARLYREKVGHGPHCRINDEPSMEPPYGCTCPEPPLAGLVAAVEGKILGKHPEGFSCCLNCGASVRDLPAVCVPPLDKAKAWELLTKMPDTSSLTRDDGSRHPFGTHWEASCDLHEGWYIYNDNPIEAVARLYLALWEAGLIEEGK